MGRMKFCWCDNLCMIEYGRNYAGYSIQLHGRWVPYKRTYWIEITVDHGLPDRSSIFAGLTSTILKLWLLISRFQRFIRKSSAEINVSPSLIIREKLLGAEHYQWKYRTRANINKVSVWIQSWKGALIYQTTYSDIIEFLADK